MLYGVMTLVITILSCTCFAQSNLTCNGFKELCNRRYNEVAYAATHNSQSDKESDVQNQNVPLTTQLEQGIRALKVHVWYDQDMQGNPIPFVCHGIDKKHLYQVPTEKILEQVPFIYKPFARSIFEKIEPIKGVVHKAFEAAYGFDNSCGLIAFNHCILDPSRRPLLVLLNEIKEFLDKNPREVITLILEDHTGNVENIVADFTKAGLINYLHAQELSQEWPYLKDMIGTRHPLVVFLHSEKEASNVPAWLHPIWDYAFDTQWDFKTANDLKDEKYDVIPNRGKEVYAAKETRNNTLFVAYHFITELVGGSKIGAKKVNKKAFLRSRIERLAKQAKKIPNIIQVDFFELPNNDIFDVVNELNGVGIYAGKPLVKF